MQLVNQLRMCIYMCIYSLINCYNKRSCSNGFLVHKLNGSRIECCFFYSYKIQATIPIKHHLFEVWKEALQHHCKSCSLNTSTRLLYHSQNKLIFGLNWLSEDTVSSVHTAYKRPLTLRLNSFFVSYTSYIFLSSRFWLLPQI